MRSDGIKNFCQSIKKNQGEQFFLQQFSLKTTSKGWKLLNWVTFQNGQKDIILGQNDCVRQKWDVTYPKIFFKIHFLQQFSLKMAIKVVKLLMFDNFCQKWPKRRHFEPIRQKWAVIWPKNFFQNIQKI